MKLPAKKRSFALRKFLPLNVFRKRNFAFYLLLVTFFYFAKMQGKFFAVRSACALLQRGKENAVILDFWFFATILLHLRG
jgi:hypothetical protein